MSGRRGCALSALTALGLGQSTCVGIGGDPLLGSGFVDILELFAQDPQTKAVVLIGEIGGGGEQEGAEYIKGGFPKPVVAFVAGAPAPPGRRMGHAGAIISGGGESAREKIDSLAGAGAIIAPRPAEIGLTVKRGVKGEKGQA